jgi:hypothetical protein
MVQPTRRCRARDERDGSDGSDWLVIIAAWVYFTRCKQCAQMEPLLFIKSCAVELVIETGFSEELIMCAFLNDAPTLDDYNSICADHR